MSGFEIVDKVKTDWRVIIVIQMCCGFTARTKSYLLAVEWTSNGALIRLNGGVLQFLVKLGSVGAWYLVSKKNNFSFLIAFFESLRRIQTILLYFGDSKCSA